MLRTLSLFVFILAMAGPVQANVVRPMSTHLGAGDLQSACGKAGGTYTPDENGDGGECKKDNCDGKGGYCSVGCHKDGTCVSSTPTILTRPVTLIGILQNGDNVVHEVQPAFTGDGNGGSSPASSPPPTGGSSTVHID